MGAAHGVESFNLADRCGRPGVDRSHSRPPPMILFFTREDPRSSAAGRSERVHNADRSYIGLVAHDLQPGIS